MVDVIFPGDPSTITPPPDIGDILEWDGTAWQPVTNGLAKDNTAAFTPTADYHPSTKKYVDDTTLGVTVFNVQDYGVVASSTGDYSDEIQAAVDAAAINGGTVYFPPDVNYYRTQDAIRSASNVSLHIPVGAHLWNAGNNGVAHSNDNKNHAISVGRHGRPDGPGDTIGMRGTGGSHSVGVLSAGDIKITLGATAKWNNTSKDFLDTSDYVPAVGDLIMVCTEDNLDGSAESDRPVPTATYLRKIAAVSGSSPYTITLDKEVTQDSPPVLTGTDDTSVGAAFLTDSTAAWIEGSLIGRTITNTTDSSTGLITANTATTVTATMSSGTWDSGDGYSIAAARYCITQVDYPNGALVLSGFNVDRHYAVENVHIYGGGKVTSQFGVAIHVANALNCTVDNLETFGWAGIYGNTMRQVTYTRLHGIITRGFCEVALGHEDVLFDGGHYTFKQDGWTETDLFGGLIQLAERGTNCIIKNLTVEGKWWGAGYTNIGGSKDVLLENIDISGACFQRMLNIGTTSNTNRNENITIRNFKASSLIMGDSVAAGALGVAGDPVVLTTWLINNSAPVSNLVIDGAELNGATNLTNATDFDTSTTGSIKDIVILNNTKSFSVSANELLISNITNDGTVIGGKQIGIVITANSGQLTNLSNSINVKGKYQGRAVYSTTGNKMVYAAGALTTDVWNDSNGTLVYTPV